MKFLLRWLGILFGSLIGLAFIAALAIYFISERALNRSYPVPAVAGLPVPTIAADIAEGQRLATLLGCYGGCHGKLSEGAVMFDAPVFARVVAPNLPAAVKTFSEAELAALIRHGVRPDGRSLFIMPSEAFAVLSDADLGRVIAFLKSLPASDGPQAGTQFGPMGRVALALGKLKPAAQMIAESAPPPKAVDDAAEHGRYLARTVCAPCHGTDLRGTSNPEFTAPDLRAVVAYTPQAFSKLLGSAVSISGKGIPFMKPMALATEAEVAALYAYLHALR